MSHGLAIHPSCSRLTSYHASCVLHLNLSKYTTPLWTTLTGLSFAFSGVLTEFVTSCSFVFGKQPYDVGDRVEIKDQDLLVASIQLNHTEFRRLSDSVIVQISHKELSGLWIANQSRSRNLRAKQTRQIVADSGVMIDVCREMKRLLNGDQGLIQEDPGWRDCKRHLLPAIDVSTKPSADSNGKICEVTMVFSYKQRVSHLKLRMGCLLKRRG